MGVWVCGVYSRGSGAADETVQAEQNLGVDRFCEDGGRAEATQPSASLQPAPAVFLSGCLTVSASVLYLCRGSSFESISR